MQLLSSLIISRRLHACYPLCVWCDLTSLRNVYGEALEILTRWSFIGRMVHLVRTSGDIPITSGHGGSRIHHAAISYMLGSLFVMIEFSYWTGADVCLKDVHVAMADWLQLQLSAGTDQDLVMVWALGRWAVRDLHLISWLKKILNHPKQLCWTTFWGSNAAGEILPFRQPYCQETGPIMGSNSCSMDSQRDFLHLSSSCLHSRFIACSWEVYQGAVWALCAGRGHLGTITARVISLFLRVTWASTGVPTISDR